MKKTAFPEEIRSWEPTRQTAGEGYVPSDYVIDAYEKGRVDGINEIKKAIQKMTVDNFEKAGELTESLIGIMREAGLNPSEALLKVNSITDFESLIIVSEEEFLSDSISEIYARASALEQEAESEFFSISFILSDLGAEYDHDKVNSDGFVLKLKKL